MAANAETFPDEELARQTQTGSLAAFEELVFRYEGRLYGFARNWGRSDTDAREVTQDTFVRAYQAIGQFDPRFSFGPWLFAIARRKCIDQYRRALPPPAEPVPDPPDTDDPSVLLARQEQRRDVWHQARACLPDLQFQALWLRYAEEMSVAEIARVLRRTQTHVKVLLFRARRGMARELAGIAPVACPAGLQTEAGTGRPARAEAGQRKLAPLKPRRFSPV